VKRRLALRARLAAFATATCLAALGVGAVGTWAYVRTVALRELDADLADGSREFFRDVENFEGGDGGHPSEWTERFVPLMLRDDFVDLRGPGGQVLYLSPRLRPETLANAHPGYGYVWLHGTRLRVGVFHNRELRLALASPLEPVERGARRLLYGFLLAAPVVATLAALSGHWLAERALAPVARLAREAEAITAERLDQRLPVPQAPDELRQLALVLNHTLERLERSFAQATRFSAEASHQLRTPLAVLRTGLDTLNTSPNLTEPDRSAVEELLDQVRRLTSLTGDLLTLAQADAGRLETRRAAGDLRGVFSACLDDAATLADLHGITLESEVPEQLPIHADPAQITATLQNLLENAVKYNRPAGRISVIVKLGDELLVRVGNTGTPIPPARQTQIFERFFRGQNDERTPGTGLGLSLAREFARAHGGDLELVVSANDWTEFLLHLPAQR
jgi:signal transduction histidine kinase